MSHMHCNHGELLLKDGIGLFTCNKCHKNYQTRSSLKAHIATVHLKVKRFECLLCHHQAYSHFEVKRHLIKYHKINYESN